jgi:hypothetical protein
MPWMKCLGFVAALLALCIGTDARAADDPLPSWNAGAVKQSIVDFVTRVTKEGGPDYVAPKDRLATFDNDGTLWIEQPMYNQFVFAIDEVKKQANQHPEWKTKEPFKSVLAGDMKAVAAMGGAPLDFGVVVRTDSPIKTVAQLKGAKIGVTTLSSLTSWLTGELSRQQGWGNDGIVRVAVGSASASIALLRTKELDGFTSGLDNALRVEKKGEGRVVVQFGNLIKDFHTFMIYARNPFIQEHPQSVRAFLAGWFDTIAYVRANKAETVKIVVDVLAQDPDIASRLYDQLTPGYSTDGKFLPASMKALARALNDQFKVPESAIAGLYTEEFLPKR